MLLSVCHGLVKRDGKRGDLVVFDDQEGARLGRLENWTTFHSTMSLDAALIWVYRDAIEARIEGLGTPTGIAEFPMLNSEVRVLSGGEDVQRSTVHHTGDVLVDVHGPGQWKRKGVLYQNQIICADQFSGPGDSGAIALDADNRVVGMVVAVTNSPRISRTVLTPISAILKHDEFDDRLEIVTRMPTDLEEPRP